jgi:hypothetical protein
MIRPLHLALAACSIGALAGCDLLLPPQRQAGPARPPDAAEPPSATKPAPRRAEVPDSVARPALEQIRVSLRRLAVAEEGFFAENGAYTQDLTKLAFRRAPDTEIEFLWSGREGWAARGTHPQLAGRDCVLFVGTSRQPPATRRYGLSGKPGVPVCDVRSRPPSRTDTAAPAAPDTASALEAVSPVVQMKVDLRKLAQAQDAYYRMMGIYSRRIETLPLQFGWQPTVEVFVTNADQHSWSARATHGSYPGKSCVVWYGHIRNRPVTDNQGRSSSRPGIPVCDE